jgi:hypothetical protein
MQTSGEVKLGRAASDVGIDTVLDESANSSAYGFAAREEKFYGCIVSFGYSSAASELIYCAESTEMGLSSREAHWGERRIWRFQRRGKIGIDFHSRYAALSIDGGSDSVDISTERVALQPLVAIGPQYLSGASPILAQKRYLGFQEYDS